MSKPTFTTEIDQEMVKYHLNFDISEVNDELVCEYSAIFHEDTDDQLINYIETNDIEISGSVPITIEYGVYVFTVEEIKFVFIPFDGCVNYSDENDYSCRYDTEFVSIMV
jgi:hypothetical protein